MVKKNNSKEKNKKILDWIVKIILIIIIIILLIHNCVLINKGNDKRSPSGNTNIIDIKCDDSKCIDKDNPVTGAGNVSGESNNSTQVPSSEDSGELIIQDKNITWADSSELDIFSNSFYNYEKKIAPEDENTYQFVVKNSTKYNLSYSFSFDEVNPHNMNLKYRLKKNDTYLNSEYVYYDKLDISNQMLNAGENDTYYLDWKWVSSDNDTEVGEAQANYKIKINVEAESVNG